MPQYKGHEVSDELLKVIQDDIKNAEPTEQKLSEIRGTERKTYAQTVKKMLATALPAAVEGISEDAHIRDYIAEIAERVSKPAPGGKKPEQNEPTETPEQLKSRLKAENEKFLRDERAKLRREAILNETVSIAIGKYGLDPEYKDAFLTKLNSLHPVEVGETGPAFRDGEGYLYDKQSKAATSEYVAEKLLTAFPKLKVAANPGPNLHTEGPGGTKTLDKSTSAKFEKSIGNMLQNIPKVG